jgi:hypothetical protein
VPNVSYTCQNVGHIDNQVFGHSSTYGSQDSLSGASPVVSSEEPWRDAISKGGGRIIVANLA